MIRIIAVLALAITGVAHAKDRACTKADIVRYQMMLGQFGRPIAAGDYIHDVRFNTTAHFLGVKIQNGVCNVQIKPVE